MKFAPDGMTNKEYSKMLWTCQVRGIGCEYGICDECPNIKRREVDKDDEGQEEEEKEI